MLSFYDNEWQLGSALIVLLTGFGCAVLQQRVLRIPVNQAALFYVWHTAFCISFYVYSLNQAADATIYYRVSQRWDDGFDFGTRGVYFLTSVFSSTLGMSYGGVFLVFNLFGFCGMLALASVLRELSANSTTTAREIAFLTILTPGLSFWSSAIGKDGLSFMATGLAVWATLRLERRYAALALSCLTMVLVRPHMVGILLASLAAALLFSTRISIGRKIALVTLIVPAAITAVRFGTEYVGLGEATGIEDVEDYFSVRQSRNLGGGSSVDIASMSMPARLLTYLCRPFFFDASGALGLIVSLENMGLVALLGYGACVRLGGRRSRLDPVCLMFVLFYSTASWFVLANATSNLGIAIRQKWMFLPMLIVLVFSYMPSSTPRSRISSQNVSTPLRSVGRR